MHRITAPLLLLLLAPSLSHAVTCDELKAQIEAKIQAAGVKQFTVSIVDTAASALGKIVGSCSKGAKKLVYVQDSLTPPAGNTQSLPAASKPAKPPVITECKDGTVITSGSCNS